MTGSRARPAIREVILTGGDPLMLSPRRLARDRRPRCRPSRMSRSCASTPACRWPTRPASPTRSPAALATDKADVSGACTPTTRASSPTRRAPRSAACRREAVPVLGQSVLLRGVNDSADGAGGAVPRHAGGAREAVLPAPARPGPRHRAVPRADRGGPPAARRAARPRHRPRLADLRARHSGRARKGAHRPRLPGARRRCARPGGKRASAATPAFQAREGDAQDAQRR